MVGACSREQLMIRAVRSLIVPVYHSAGHRVAPQSQRSRLHRSLNKEPTAWLTHYPSIWVLDRIWKVSLIRWLVWRGPNQPGPGSPLRPCVDRMIWVRHDERQFRPDFAAPNDCLLGDHGSRCI